MSGGSYDYLFQLGGRTGITESDAALIEAMAQRLDGLGYATVAAYDTWSVLLSLKRALTQALELADVWKAVEWWDSSDWSEDQVHAALTAYDMRLKGSGRRQIDNDRLRTRIAEVVALIEAKEGSEQAPTVAPAAILAGHAVPPPLLGPADAV